MDLFQQYENLIKAITPEQVRHLSFKLLIVVFVFCNDFINEHD